MYYGGLLPPVPVCPWKKNLNHGGHRGTQGYTGENEEDIL